MLPSNEIVTDVKCKCGLDHEASTLAWSKSLVALIYMLFYLFLSHWIITLFFHAPFRSLHLLICSWIRWFICCCYLHSHSFSPVPFSFSWGVSSMAWFPAQSLNNVLPPPTVRWKWSPIYPLQHHSSLVAPPHCNAPSWLSLLVHTEFGLIINLSSTVFCKITLSTTGKWVHHRDTSLEVKTHIKLHWIGVTVCYCEMWKRKEFGTVARECSVFFYMCT